ncbi:MAG TPA: hypothetical protein VFP25_04805 [Nitrososphaeraceae archaeon]|nr:hypothetical protein [Nitrososphaeraceae archaeon]
MIPNPPSKSIKKELQTEFNLFQEKDLNGYKVTDTCTDIMHFQIFYRYLRSGRTGT